MKAAGIKRLARKLRHDSTEAEKRLWKQLRNRQLAGIKFRRQCPVGPYVVDFLCYDLRLVIELDGGQHTIETDARRTACLEAEGLRLLRFWNNEVLENMDGVLQTIIRIYLTPPLSCEEREPDEQM